MSMARKQSLPKKPLSRRPDHLRKFYGANLAEVFRTPAYDCSLRNECGVPDFALTRLKGGTMEMQRAPAYPEDRAMLICVALAPTPVDRWRARIAGQEVTVSHSIAFATTVIDLMKPMEMWAAGPFDYLHYYVSRDLLDRVAADNRIAPVDSFRMVFFERNLVIAQLTKTILSQVRNREPLNMLALEDVSLLVSTHLLQHYGNGKGILRVQPSLEIWQKILTESLLSLLSPELWHFSSSMAHQASNRHGEESASRTRTESGGGGISVGILRSGCLHTRVYYARRDNAVSLAQTERPWRGCY